MHVDRVELAHLGGKRLVISRTDAHESDDAAALLRDEHALRRTVDGTLPDHPAAGTCRIEAVQVLVGKLPAVRDLPRLDVDVDDRVDISLRRSPDDDAIGRRGFSRSLARGRR